MPNDMRDRLIELISDKENELLRSYPYTTNEYRIACLADYLIENGAILPPCKVGTYVYFITDVNCQYFTIKFGRVYEIVITSNDNLFLSIVEYDESDNVVDEWDIPKCQWGKTVFLTREDAEKSIREREGE